MTITAREASVTANALITAIECAKTEDAEPVAVVVSKHTRDALIAFFEHHGGWYRDVKIADEPNTIAGVPVLCDPALPVAWRITVEPRKAAA